VRNNPLALVDPMGLCHMGADNVAYDDEPGDCGGGSVTVTAQAPPDVMPIFVSLPSLRSDTQQPAPTAPPPAVTEASVAVRPFEPGNSRQGNKQMICLIEAAKDKGIPIALDVIGASPAVGNAVAATGRIARAALALNHAITNPVVLASLFPPTNRIVLH